MAMDAAVKQAGGKASDRQAIVKALEKADYASVRGPFTYGKNHYPIQAYYQRVKGPRSEEHTSELQSHLNIVCRLLLEKKKLKDRRKTRSQRSYALPKH